jgi:hypothetical protein
MRLTSIYSVVCDCGRVVEWPDATREFLCACGRVLVVAAWPNDPKMTVGPDGVGGLR